MAWLALACGGPARAQGQVALSLEEALVLARDRSEQVEVAAAGVERARGQLMQARSGFFPEILGSVAYTRTFASEFEDIGSFGGPSGEAPEGEAPDGEGPEGEAPGGLGELGDLPFGRENTWNIGLTVTQILYAGGRVRAQTAIAEAGRDVAALDVLQARAQVLHDTAQAYFDVQLAAEFADIAASGVALARTTLDQTRVGFEVGALPEFDVLRAQVEVDNRAMDLVVANRQRDVAELRLHQLVEIPPGTALVLTTPLSVEADPSRPAVALADIPPELDADRRAAVRQADLRVDIAEAGVRVARSQWYPTVAASLNAGLVAYPDGILPPLDPGEWRQNITAGVSLQVPLFTGFRIRGEVIAARADQAESEALRDQTGELAELDAATALADLAAAEATLEATVGTAAVAQRAYDIAQLRYQQGAGSQIELQDALLQLQQARANRAQAVRDLLLARVRLALLPALPLQAGAGAARTGAGDAAARGAELRAVVPNTAGAAQGAARPTSPTGPGGFVSGTGPVGAGR